MPTDNSNRTYWRSQLTTSTFIVVDVVIPIDDVDIGPYGPNCSGSSPASRITGGDMNKTLFLAVAALSLATSAAHAEAITVLVESGGHSLQQAAADAFTKETGIEVNFVEVPYQGV